MADARYTGGAPVIGGPFGGDGGFISEGERRIAAYVLARSQRPWWRKLFCLEPR